MASERAQMMMRVKRVTRGVLKAAVPARVITIHRWVDRAVSVKMEPMPEIERGI